jgi:hypothetical protein
MLGGFRDSGFGELLSGRGALPKNALHFMTDFPACTTPHPSILSLADFPNVGGGAPQFRSQFPVAFRGSFNALYVHFCLNCFAPNPSVFCISVSYVVRVSPYAEVAWVYAARVVAAVHYYHPFGNFTLMGDIRKPMCTIPHAPIVN